MKMEGWLKLSQVISIRDFAGNKSSFILENSKDVKEIWIEIITGDEVVTVFYKDGTHKTFDSSTSRVYNCSDIVYELPLGLVDVFSNFEGTPYDCWEKIEWLKRPIKD